MIAEQLLNSYHYWLSYTPFEPQYSRYDIATNAAGLKIADVYKAISTARQSLIYLDVDDYGQLIASNDSTHLNFIRSYFVVNALLLYGISVDLSWQVAWLRFGDPSLDWIYKEDRLMAVLKKCSYLNLDKLLKNGHQNVLDHINSFCDSPLTKTVRDRYNYVKHRGMFAIEGEINSGSLGISFNEVVPKVFSRKAIDIREWTNELIEFHNTFVTYFDTLIQMIMPADYTDTKLSIGGLMHFNQAVKEYLENNS